MATREQVAERLDELVAAAKASMLAQCSCQWAEAEHQEKRLALARAACIGEGEAAP